MEASLAFEGLRLTALRKRLTPRPYEPKVLKTQKELGGGVDYKHISPFFRVPGAWRDPWLAASSAGRPIF